VTRMDFLALAFASACLLYGCQARADEAAPDTQHARCLTITPHASPTVDADSPEPARAPKIDAHAAEPACPVGWSLEAGVCLP
jgi:hypothetical protein